MMCNSNLKCATWLECILTQIVWPIYLVGRIRLIDHNNKNKVNKKYILDDFTSDDSVACVFINCETQRWVKNFSSDTVDHMSRFYRELKSLVSKHWAPAQTVTP